MLQSAHLEVQVQDMSCKVEKLRMCKPGCGGRSSSDQEELAQAENAANRRPCCEPARTRTECVSRAAIAGIFHTGWVLAIKVNCMILLARSLAWIADYMRWSFGWLKA